MITADLLSTVPLFANVPDSERETIAARAADLQFQKGDYLVMEGETPSFFVLLSGRVTVLKRVGLNDRALTSFEAGSFFGEVPLLLGSKALATLRAETPVRVMRLDQQDFREIIVGCRRLNAEVMKIMADRLGRVQQFVVDTPVPMVKIVGHQSDVTCHDMRDFLSRNHVTYSWFDVDQPDPAEPLPADAPSCDNGVVVMLPDGKSLVAPTFRQIAEQLNLNTAPQREMYDVVIVGGGVAGLASAVYGASEGLCTLLVERVAPGGQAGTSSRIENYLGFPTGLSGDELSTLAERQAERLGAELVVARSVESIDPGEDTVHRLVLDGGTRIAAESIVIATGVSWRQLTVRGFDRFVSRGIFSGAASTEARTTRGKDVYLVGGGNSAGQAALLVAGYARSVTLVIRGHRLEETMSQYLIDQLRARSNIQVEADTEVVEARGDEHLEEIVIEQHRQGTQEVRSTRALFVFIGANAETAWLPSAVIRDELGYVCTGRDLLDLGLTRGERWPLTRDPYLLETSVPGVFAVGDVRHGSIKRCASAVGEGSMAIAFIHQYLAQESRARESAAATG
jgi:thioredoxin reductase (NADPH)